MQATTPILGLLFVLAACASSRIRDLPVPEGRYGPAIRAAASIEFSSDRSSTLQGIAAKPDLTEREQVYLVEVLALTGGFSSDRTRVLLALLRSPAVAGAARTKVAELLPDLDLFSSDRKQVVDALAGDRKNS